MSFAIPPQQQRAATSPLVGRQGALAELEGAVAAGGLVELLGPPGVGKTRLAQELASGGRGLFCDLTEARDEGAFLHRVAAALGLPAALDAAHGALAERIAAALRGPRRERLIVLDNFEQLPRVADGHVASWAAAGGAAILVTSRRRLADGGGRAVLLEPLSLERPAPGGWSEAAGLLVTRAGAFAGHGWESAAEREAIERLAAALDGLPLALELAAARLRLLSPLQLLERLAARFRLLRRPEGAAGRNDLRESLAASFAMLGEGEQAALIALSVFRGSFTLDAAEAVLGGDDEVWALDRLETLLDHSVLAVEDDPREKRYRLLLCIREFAEEQGRDVAAELRHAAYTVEVAERALEAGDPRVLIHERENLAAVVERAQRVGASLALRAAVALAAPGCALPYAAVEAHLSAALAAAADEGPAALRCTAHLRRGTLRRFLGRLDEAGEDLEAAVALARESGSGALLAEALEGLGHNAAVHARWGVERRFLAEAAAADPDPRNEGRWLVLLANSHCNEDDHENAERIFRAALAAADRAGDARWQAMARLALGVMLLEVGQLAEAAVHLGEALEMHRRSGSPHWEGVTLGFVARWRQERGDLPGALSLYAEALDRIERAGVRRAEGVARLHFAAALLESGEPAAATGQLRQALELVRETCPDHEGFCLALQGAAAMLQGAPQEAALLFERAGAALAPYSRPIFRAALGLFRGDAVPDELAACSDVRLAARIAGRFPRAADASPLLVAADGGWFRPPGAEASVSLQRRRSLRGILAALVEQRRERPGVPLDLPALVEAGWPGERILAHAAAERVYAAVATLRRLGLRGVLLQRDEGYLLAPENPIILG